MQKTNNKTSDIDFLIDWFEQRITDNLNKIKTANYQDRFGFYDAMDEHEQWQNQVEVIEWSIKPLPLQK